MQVVPMQKPDIPERNLNECATITVLNHETPLTMLLLCSLFCVLYCTFIALLYCESTVKTNAQRYNDRNPLVGEQDKITP